MNIYQIVLNKNEVKNGMESVIDELNPVQRATAVSIYSNNIVKIGDNFIKFLVKDDYLISKLHGLDIDEIVIGDDVALNQEEIDFLRSKTSRISGLKTI